ncbi:MAG: stage III sporulation protein SpoIIIAB [Sarcina sp.]
MLKIIILVLIVILCSFIGYLYGEEFKKRYLDLLEIMRCFIDIENEIIYSYRPLPEILDSVAKKSHSGVATVFFSVSEFLLQGKVDGVNEAFIKAINSNKDNLAIKSEDYEIILDLSKSLGETDIAGQEQIFLLAKEKLTRVINIAENDYRRNCKMYKGLGFYVGIMVAIFLI